MTITGAYFLECSQKGDERVPSEDSNHKDWILIKDMFYKLPVNGKPYRGAQQCGKLAKLNFCYDFA